MIKKIFPLLIVGLFVLNGFHAASIQNDESMNNHLSVSFSFSEPTIDIQDSYVHVELPESTSSLMQVNNPSLPLVSKTFRFPFKTTLKQLTVTFSQSEKQIIPGLIKPASSPAYISTEFSIPEPKIIPNPEIYDSYQTFPEKQYWYRLGTGLYEEKLTTFVTVFISPMQYLPADDTIILWKEAHIDLEVDIPQNPVMLPDEYDLLILTPAEFSDELGPLVEEKQAHEIKTNLVSLEDIPEQGIDIQESIKYFIKDAIEEWGISSVLLVGGGLEGKEQFPVRYAWVPSGNYEKKFPSDLYYADVYDANGNFSSWDNNSNGKYAEFPDDNVSVDLYPDVSIGRLPCETAEEVTTVVNKIIRYMTKNKMTNHIVQMGGDTFPGDPHGVNEGEYANTQVMEQLPTYTTTQLWGSEGNLRRFNIIWETWKGADFLDFSGHGSYLSWATHPPQDDKQWLPDGRFYTGFVYIDTEWLINFWKLPVVVLNACSCSKFSESKNCLGWSFVKNEIGGGIASYGASGIGYGSYGTSETDRLFGWMEVHLLKKLGMQKTLGQTWNECLVEYINSFELEEVDYKTIYEMTLIGDPSLAITNGSEV
ncbi:MAG: C25 family cysteine peptidase [Thermoplasmatota archaeon]